MYESTVVYFPVIKSVLLSSNLTLVNKPEQYLLKIQCLYKLNLHLKIFTNSKKAIQSKALHKNK